jgi:hypothetical protein
VKPNRLLKNSREGRCEERFSRRGNLEVIDFVETEFASLRSHREQKDFSNDLLNDISENSSNLLPFLICYI